MNDVLAGVCAPRKGLAGRKCKRYTQPLWLDERTPIPAESAVIAIVDYEAGNLKSVELAVEHLGCAGRVTSDPRQIERAERVIFPGVGAAGTAMDRLTASGLGEAVIQAVKSGKPVLGICLGTQIVLDSSEENDMTCLGVLPGRVRRFPTPLMEEGKRLKVPHMGWNSVEPTRAHPVFEGVETGSEFYFVHSYYADPADDADVIGTTRYGITCASALARDNLVALQFHPEKSGRAGLTVLDNFLKWSG